MLKGITNWVSRITGSQNGDSALPGADILSREEHGISRSEISPAALKVMYRLNNNDFQAYLVGGGVRDLLLGGHPKDFDIATDATPEEVRQLFRNSRIIGRRFKIVHVRFGPEIIEVTTFRGGYDNEAENKESGKEGKNTTIEKSQSGMLLRDNAFGSLEEDAIRRDFTVNALYYTVDNFEVLDFCQGLQDLDDRKIRIIGDPQLRYREDPVRILRAVRFAAKLDFEIETATRKPIKDLARLLNDIPSARLFDESLKLFMGGYAEASLESLIKYEVLGFLFPATARCLHHPDETTLALLTRATSNTDRRIAEGKPVTPAFIYAALLWPPLRQQLVALQTQGLSPHPAFHQAATHVLEAQIKHTAIPRRFSTIMREIWELQSKLEARAGRKVYTLYEHPRFRAAYDFLLLREEAGEPTNSSAQWWTEFQDVSEEQRTAMVDNLEAPRKKRRKPRRRKPPADQA
ncbi:MAG: polynucleotide adenylyltransferase PcnB [Pseudomonadales bacterium]